MTHPRLILGTDPTSFEPGERAGVVHVLDNRVDLQELRDAVACYLEAH